MNKKGQGISMTYIIIALLALVVLVVIILFFYGGMEKFGLQAKEIGKTTEQQMSIWRGQCKIYCTTDKKEFCEHIFEASKDKAGEVIEIAECNSDAFTGDLTSYGDVETIDLKTICDAIKQKTDCPP